MPEKSIEQFMAAVRAELVDLPAGRAQKALEYYEEFIFEAREAGRSEEEILSRLGSVRDIAAQARAEATLDGLEANPGPLRLITARRRVLRGLADSAGRLSLIVASSIPFFLACAFYVVAGGLAVSGVAWAVLMVRGIAGMAPVFVREIISVSGATLFSLAVLAVIALAAWQAANAMGRVTLGILRKGLRRGQGQEARQRPKTRPSSAALRRAYLICGLTALAGACLAASSSLPLRLFSLWNSERPADLSVSSWTFSSAAVRELTVETLNTSIVLRPSSAPTIKVTYEEPPWLAGAPTLANGKFDFRETSRGMVPYMPFIARHPGTTSVTIEVPRDFRPATLAASSIGGSITIDVSAKSIRATAATGLIRYAMGNNVRLKVTAPHGMAVVRGVAIPGDSFQSGPSGGSPVEIISTEGRVEIQ